MTFTMKTSLAWVSFIASASVVSAQGAQSGSGRTTRYWDCCKPSCAWPGKGQDSGIVRSCSKDDSPLSDNNVQSGCAGGSAYMCSDQSPWAVNDNLAYGFAAITASDPKCCQCYQLTFKSAPIAGKKMIVQATNTGNDVSNSQFDIAMPGGGFGQFDGCSTEWGATEAVWGQRYGGPTSNTCPQFPSALQPGCGFRWGWMKGADNPDVDYEIVPCPQAIVDKSGCGVGSGSTTTPEAETPTSGSASSSASASASAGTTGDEGTTEEDTTTPTSPTTPTTPTTEEEPETEQPPVAEGETDTTGEDPVGQDPIGQDPVGENTTGSDPEGSTGTTPPSSSISGIVSPTGTPGNVNGTETAPGQAQGGKGGKYRGGWKGRKQYHGRPKAAGKVAGAAGEDCDQDN